jgi:predicted enzyme related to lactoylglutathione lyase
MPDTENADRQDARADRVDIVLRSENPGNLARFYAALGLEVVPEKHGSGPAHYFCRTGDTAFEIYPRRADGKPVPAAKMGFEMAVDAACVAAVAGGGIIVRQAADFPGGRQATIRDPDGNVVDLMQAKPTR